MINVLIKSFLRVYFHKRGDHLKYYYFPQIICYTDKKLGRIHLPKSLSDTYFDLIFGIVYYRFKSSSLRFWKFTSSIKMRIFI